MAKGPIWPTPQMFPSRDGYYFDPGVPNRQLWAIGMISVQWGMLELTMHQAVQNLTGPTTAEWDDYRKQSSFKHQLAFYKALVVAKMQEPRKAKALALISDIQRLKSQRHRVIHGTWGGGMETESWSSEDGKHPTSDGSLVSNHLDQNEWSLTFARLKQISQELSFLVARFAEFNFTLDTTSAPLPGA